METAGKVILVIKWQRTWLNWLITHTHTHTRTHTHTATCYITTPLTKGHIYGQGNATMGLNQCNSFIYQSYYNNHEL